MFTSSHHEPFDIPSGRLAPEFDQPGTPKAAVRYADFALGQFLDRAATRPWFENTLVLVVADHDVRVYGDEVIPVRRFQVPGLIVGGGTEPRVIRSLASHIDLAPTMLSLMGVETTIPFPGRDLSASLPEFGIADGPAPRAILQFEDRYAWLLADELRVMFPGGLAQRWKVSDGGNLSDAAIPMTDDERLELHAQALLGDWLYRQQAYALDPPASPSGNAQP